MRIRPGLPVGTICGLAWAASLRGWMAQLAGPAHSHVTWLTVLLVLLPGALVGAAFGRSIDLRSSGRPVGRWLCFAPALLAAAILDPVIFHQLITDGRGGGSLLVVLTLLAGGFTIGSRRWTPLRVLAALLTAAGVLAMFGVATIAGAPSTPRGLWVALYGTSLVTVGAVASATPWRARVDATGLDNRLDRGRATRPAAVTDPSRTAR